MPNRYAALHRTRVWRQMAEECRMIAERMLFRDTRATYRRLADEYDTMARREEQRAPRREDASCEMAG